MNDDRDQARDGKFIQGYNNMLARVRDIYDEAERHALPALQHTIETAIDYTIQLGELTRAEAELIGNYLKRDLQDAAAYLAGSGTTEFSDWLKIDATLIENELLDLFSSVADKTKIGLTQWALQAAAADIYGTGEITSIGTLQCQSCGELLHFSATAHIPNCPHCGEKTFHRVT